MTGPHAMLKKRIRVQQIRAIKPRAPACIRGARGLPRSLPFSMVYMPERRTSDACRCAPSRVRRSFAGYARPCAATWQRLSRATHAASWPSTLSHRTRLLACTLRTQSWCSGASSVASRVCTRNKVYQEPPAPMRAPILSSTAWVVGLFSKIRVFYSADFKKRPTMGGIIRPHARYTR